MTQSVLARGLVKFYQAVGVLDASLAGRRLAQADLNSRAIPALRPFGEALRVVDCPSGRRFLKDLERASETIAARAPDSLAVAYGYLLGDVDGLRKESLWDSADVLRASAGPAARFFTSREEVLERIRIILGVSTEDNARVKVIVTTPRSAEPEIPMEVLWRIFGAALGRRNEDRLGRVIREILLRRPDADTIRSILGHISPLVRLQGVQSMEGPLDLHFRFQRPMLLRDLGDTSPERRGDASSLLQFFTDRRVPGATDLLGETTPL